MAPSRNTITVIMPVFNGEVYLQEAIDSILQQSFSDFEFIIINDGSTDNSREIILSYNDDRIRLIENGSNRGINYSLNAGLDMATGDYVARQDADDAGESLVRHASGATLTKQPRKWKPLICANARQSGWVATGRFLFLILLLLVILLFILPK